jgi:photosystem II stability/assembly factor-like uncharacterized protein
MTLKTTLLAFIISITTNTVIAQNWQSTGALNGTGSNQFLTAAAHIENNIYVVSSDQLFAHSEDKGKTWTTPEITKPNGTFAYLKGIKNRLYASLRQINGFDYELQYSLDNGANWQLDTIGLPKNIVNTGKSSMILEDMRNDYILAHNYTKFYYKKIEETVWKETANNFGVFDVTATSNKWIAIVAGKIVQSIDNGESWSDIATIGLPANFQGYEIVSSNTDRLFICNAPAASGQDIYFSEDGGINWTLTNSAGLYSYANPWIEEMYAVNNHVYASIKPELFKLQVAPSYIVSSAATPDFSIGDLTGIPAANTSISFPFYFHIDDELFTMYGDLYSSEMSSNTASLNDEKLNDLKVYPNPFQNKLNLSIKENSEWVLYAIDGKKIRSGKVTVTDAMIPTENLKSGFYFLKVKNDKGTKSFCLIKN